MQVWVLCATTKSKNVSTNQRQKRGSSLLHTQRRQKESQSQRRSLATAQTPRRIHPGHHHPPSFSFSSEVLRRTANATARSSVTRYLYSPATPAFLFLSPSSPHIKRFLSYSLYLPTFNGMPEGKAEDRVRHSFRKLTTFIEN